MTASVPSAMPAPGKIGSASERKEGRGGGAEGSPLVREGKIRSPPACVAMRLTEWERDEGERSPWVRKLTYPFRAGMEAGRENEISSSSSPPGCHIVKERRERESCQLISSYASCGQLVEERERERGRSFVRQNAIRDFSLLPADAACFLPSVRPCGALIQFPLLYLTVALVGTVSQSALPWKWTLLMTDCS